MKTLFHASSAASPYYVAAALVALAASACAGNTPPNALSDNGFPRTLPIFELAAPDPSVAPSAGAQRLLGISGDKSTRDDRVVVESGSRIAEVFPASGGVWLADRAQLWNADLRPSLPDSTTARRMADQLVRENQLLPALQEPFTWEVTQGATLSARLDLHATARDVRQLDQQVSYNVHVRIPGVERPVPIVGGGGQFTLTLGDGGKPIGFSGVWRPVKGIARQAAVVPAESADARFRSMTRGLRIASVNAMLAYYSSPVHLSQQYLYPVYVYRAIAEVDHRRMPLRLIMVPATEFGPRIPMQPQMPARSRTDFPQRRSTDDRDDDTTGASGVPGTAMVDGSRGRGRGPRAPVLEESFRRPDAANPFEAGTSWIGMSGGLSGSHDNAKGFVDGLTGDGWAVNFNWGDENAFESDWNSHDDQWVDAADFVFYTGHADMNGWVLHTPADGFLSFTEVGTVAEAPGDLWGQQDLEWIIVAACGPLQDDVISPGGGDVFARWDGAFDGLHLLMGYGAVTSDNTEEGKRVVHYAREGATLIDSWFRTAREIQDAMNGYPPPDGPMIWVGVVYPIRSGTNPGNDHLWNHGFVSADPTSPQGYIAIWTTT